MAAMLAFGLAVRQGLTPGPFTCERAELFARLLLMDEWSFRVSVARRLDDHAIAQRFGAPVEQVAKKPRDLGLNV